MTAQQSFRGAAPNATAQRTPATGTAHVNVGLTERVLSAVAGAALAYAGTQTRSKIGKPVLLALGAGLALRGASGYCPLNQAFGRDSAPTQLAPVEIKETFTISRPIDEVYAYWRQLGNLPRFMEHLESVRQLDQRRSHWEARVPGGAGTISWEAEITTEEPGRLLVYRSLPGSQIDQSGEVRFRPAEGGQGTEIQTITRYRAPGGALGKGVAKLLNPALAELVRRDVRRFKMVMETGEAGTTHG
ncbi:SRPBCC family protein [Hymenobacter sp. CRA2]|uniref:SRPBCC family protein n=1 Tax=Hymenobacter sp. CRA2 TaxID=1955620 RepID=UPI00098FC5EF|nr:SRPBCC family protein [Hymenobacter sp. CRA2]OON67664.1 hypothetical protein B0919_17740 [Hymenobacter sp. CRA2]